MVPPGLPPDDTLVTWSGPMSPSNPRNFSTATKWYACILVSWSTFLANAATNMIAPALGLMSVTYKELYTMWIRGSLIGSYIFAFTFAPLIFGPMSEIMGRKPVLIIGTVVFFVACLLSGFVTAVWQLMLLRFLSALGASAPMSIGGAVLTDMFAPDERGRAMTLFALAPQLAPSLGPIMGGWIAQEAKEWRWIFFTAAICGFTAAAPMFFVRETYTPAILARRAKKLRKETGNTQLTTIFERRQETKKQIITRGVVRPLVLFTCEPIVQLLTLYVSLIYGIIHLMVATFPAVFGTIYAEYPGWASMHFITITIGTIVGGFLGGYLVEKHYHNLSLNNRGIAKPEFKFYCMLYTVWIPPFGLMVYGLITYYGIHWIFADIGIVIFCVGISIAVVAIQSYMVDCYSLLAGSALTATIVVRSICGTGATIGSEDLLLHAGMLWSNVILSAACIFIGVPAAYAVYFWGASMRQKSRHATHKR
ncbi:putative mfs-multidrug-resistance transporter [Meira miltonrushii]|uniref:Putative mfs-multidrug-resistance transporter n=1 Tax=Meira miltonrushii TaxID=1280837 RepID=A0A316VG04_9BASI|nr:putative mfs-multidrug-resistance transporter [Meira miltonrushii]PWN34931.1 putative mfs-multidrug-resistance transporter [Meira miltonrushii]